MNTYRNRISNPFRMNTYEKTGGGGGGTPTRPFSRSLLFTPSVSREGCSFLHSFLPRDSYSTRGAVCGNSSSYFSIASALFAKTPGCAPEQNPPSPCKSTLYPRTKPMSLPAWLKTSFPLHPRPHGGTIWSVIGLAGSSVIRETFPLVPVSKIEERTTGSTARLIQQLARDRRPGPLAIRGRHPALPFREKGRPGKASSFRLGSIVGP